MYTLINSEGTLAQRSSDGAFVPWDGERNCPVDAAGVTYRQWVEDGSPVAAAYYAPPSPVPDSASKLGLKRALEAIGKWDSVKAAIASDPDVQEEWGLAIEIKRTDALTQGIIAKLQLSPDQVDALLIAAKAAVE